MDARVYTFTKLYDRRIPNVGVGVRVGVGPMEFQLYADVRRRTSTHSRRLHSKRCVALRYRAVPQFTASGVNEP